MLVNDRIPEYYRFRHRFIQASTRRVDHSSSHVTLVSPGRKTKTFEYPDYKSFSHPYCSASDFFAQGCAARQLYV
ncbi:hypothetical protein RRG08_005680 [Elysia crispata]|uniref:Uncharacterized protein n=1 Tax=Elysia crispata TaxID=231223 RepID=A0AAE1CWH5_9GAST|nr:hypothetical protein RRG08_005680 [Elysia crispata]